MVVFFETSLILILMETERIYSLVPLQIDLFYILIFIIPIKYFYFFYIYSKIKDVKKKYRLICIICIILKLDSVDIYG